MCHYGFGTNGPLMIKDWIKKAINKIGIRAQALLLFFAVAAVIMFFAPQDKKFKFQFVEGKPWQYELLTAPYMFPIYKSAEVLEIERDSVRRSINPYFTIDTKLSSSILLKFDEDYATSWSTRIPKEYYHYVRKFLEQMYQSGLIEEEQLVELRRNQRLEVNLLGKGGVSDVVPITRFYTLKEAYQSLFNNIPEGLNRDLLSQLNVTNYLRINVVYNESTTEKVTQDEILKIPLSNGMVQKDERIIDRGQIVDARTYNVLMSYKKVYEEEYGGVRGRLVVSLSTLLLLALLMTCMWAYMNIYRPEMFKNLRNALFIILTILPLIVLTELSIKYQLFSVYIIPYAIVPILVRTFFESRTALFIHLTMVLICASFVPFPYEFILLQMVAGIVTVFSLRKLSSRAQLIRATFLVFITYVTLTLLLSLMQNGAFEEGDFLILLLFGINLIFLMFSYLLVYLVERMFGYTSNISLVELSDINTPLLKKLSENAPGTLQHSMQIAILASEAASKVGADSQLVRAGALYHDIGKMLNPSYFTENQGNINPHNALTYKESAAVIIRHVTDGVALAKQNKLPRSVIDFIRTHHGCGRTKYFYTRYYNEHPNEEIDPTPFTYPGPNPFSKETGILMLADAVEASSRSLKVYTPEALTEQVNKIVDAIVAEGFIDNTPLTFRDMTTIKEVFVEKLLTMYHSRIQYPELIQKPQTAQNSL